jgi:hypothetical protein
MKMRSVNVSSKLREPQIEQSWLEGVPAVDNLDCTAPPSLFVAQLAGELAPARIADGLREPAVSHHASHVEILDNQPVVGLNQRVGYLMQEMTADVGDTAMMLAQAGRSAATIK